MGVATMPVGMTKSLKQAVPMALFDPHWEQALKNHDQTLERLAARGGLTWSEALALLEERPWVAMPEERARQVVRLLWDRWVAEQGGPG